MRIRLEEPGDYRAVENLTREAFWNKYRPGCDEHFLVHRFRGRPDFEARLDCVLEEEGEIVAHILYSKAFVNADGGGRLPVATFGPVSVAKQWQGRGYGGALIQFTLKRAAELGYGAVAITGDIGYYRRFGFASGASLGIDYPGAPRGEEVPFFLVKELRSGFLTGVRGVYEEPAGYRATRAEVEAFDRGFPPKEKKKLPGQLVDG